MSAHKFIRPLAYLTALVMIVAGGSLAWPNDNKNEKYRVTAYFTKAIGLFPNSDVNVLGVPVGKIHSVEPAGNRVKVEMDVFSEHKIPADARAQIVPISVISDRYVEFFPPYEGGPALSDGSVINEDRTQIPAELDDVFKQLKKLLEAVEPGGPGEPGALGALIVELNATLHDREDDLQGTLSNTAQLTRTLASTEEDLTGILTNLNDLFGTLATRSDKFDDLNKNLILVLRALAESRGDLEGTLINLSDLGAEVTDLIKDHGDTVKEDLRQAVKITKLVLDNRVGVERSLKWLPVLGIGLKRAFHPQEGINAIDVRDNLQAKVECDALETIPKDPIFDTIRELLKDICGELTGEPGGGLPPLPTPGTSEHGTPPPVELNVGCAKSVRKVKRQLRRVGRLGLPDHVKEDLLAPLRERLELLAKKCDELADELKDPEQVLEELLDQLPEIGDAPDVDEPVDDLFGNAAGASVAAPRETKSFGDRVDDWMDDVFGFVGL